MTMSGWFNGGCRWLMIGCFGVILGSCDESENYLRGSLADSYDMEFDSIRARLYASELSIEYVVDSEQGEKITLRVTLNAGAGVLVAGKTYNLATDGTISRGEGFDAKLPELSTGTLDLSEYAGTDGSAVEGEFSATFITTNQNKLSLRGAFVTELEIVQP